MLSRLKKKTQADDLPPTVEAASDGTKGYPQDYSVGSLRERRLLMALRTVGFGFLVAIIVVLVQTFLLVSLMPLKEVRPFLVQVADEGTVVAAIQPIQDTFEAKNVLTEKLVREYIVNRHEILRSNSVMQLRWGQEGYLGLTTNNAEYSRFRTSVAPVLEQIRQLDAERKVAVISVSALRVGEVYIVDFRSTSTDERNRVVDERIYTATLEIAFLPLRDLTREQMLINPTGFTVVQYSLAEKDQ
jgi:type IV secretory pathway component VirB8